MRNEIEQSKQTAKKKRRHSQRAKKKQGAKKVIYIEECEWKKEEQAEGIQKEQTSRILRSRHEGKAKELGKGSRKAMTRNGQRWCIGETSITSAALMPIQTPMCTLCSGVST